jgi:hypothetical protein
MCLSVNMVSVTRLMTIAGSIRPAEADSIVCPESNWWTTRCKLQELTIVSISSGSTTIVTCRSLQRVACFLQFSSAVRSTGQWHTGRFTK